MASGQLVQLNINQSQRSICLSILIQYCSYWTRWPYAACSSIMMLHLWLWNIQSQIKLKYKIVEMNDWIWPLWSDGSNCS